DRTRLIAACRANLSPIFLLHPDESGRVGECLSEVTAEKPAVDFRDPHEVRHELWHLDRADAIGVLQAAMRPEWTFIADGHHRYESAVSVMRSLPGEEGARRVLAFFCSLKDRGFRIFPIHRLLRRSSVSGESGRSDSLQTLLKASLAHEELETA